MAHLILQSNFISQLFSLCHKMLLSVHPTYIYVYLQQTSQRIDGAKPILVNFERAHKAFREQFIYCHFTFFGYYYYKGIRRGNVIASWLYGHKAVPFTIIVSPSPSRTTLGFPRLYGTLQNAKTETLLFTFTMNRFWSTRTQTGTMA